MTIEWKLNTENKKTKDGKLTRKVENIIDLSEFNIDERNEILTEVGMVQDEQNGNQWVDSHAVIREHFGEPTRVLGIAFVDGRSVMLGDCPCRGAECRGKAPRKLAEGSDKGTTGSCGHAQGPSSRRVWRNGRGCGAASNCWG